MTKTDLIDHVAEMHSLTKAEAGAIIGTVFDKIVDVVSQGDSAVIPGFGTFKVTLREARKGFNPKTKEPIEISAAKLPRFSAGTRFKSRVAG